MTEPQTPVSAGAGGGNPAWDLSFLDESHPAVASSADAPSTGAFRSGGAGSAYGGAGGSGMVTHGLNVTVCRDISIGFVRSELDLDELTKDAERAVRRMRAEWHGPDAEKFYAQWATNRAQVMEMVEAMQRLRKLLDIAIDEQVEASRA